MMQWHPEAVLREDIMAMFEKEAPELSISWAHKPTYITVKGKTKFTCSCGKQGSKHETATDARIEYETHVGLRKQKS